MILPIFRLILFLLMNLRKINSLTLEFLCSKRIPVFSVSRTAVSLFRDNHHQLEKFKIEEHLIFGLFIFYFLL